MTTYLSSKLKDSIYQTFHTPLKCVHADVKIKDFVADVTLTHTWINDRDQWIESEYLTPMIAQDIAIYGFKAKIGETLIVAEIHEDKVADKEYTEAVEEGNTAFMSGMVGDDILKFSIGNIAPNSEITTQLFYTQKLTSVGDLVKFSLPTCIGPRYASQPFLEKHEFMQPSLTSTQQADYFLDIDYHISTTRPLKTIIHSIRDIIDGYQDRTTHHIKLNGLKLDNNIDLLIGFEGINKPLCTQEWDGQKGGALVSFIPTIGNTPPSNPQSHEVLFIIDRSGSMGGKSIQAARNALYETVKAFPNDSYFNIISFGSDFKKMFPQSVKKEKINLEATLGKINAMNADLGGTEMRRPFEQALRDPLPSNTVTRQIILITDGGIGDYDKKEILKMLRRDNMTRVFTIGIGSAVSHSLIRDIAKVSGGEYEVINYSNEKDMTKEHILGCVNRQVDRMFKPVLRGAKIQWNTDKCHSTTQQLRPMFTDEPYTIFGQLDEPFPDGHKVDLIYKNYQGIEITETLDVGEVKNGGILGRLAANERLLEMKCIHDDMEKMRVPIVKLSQDYNILSPFTKFIGVKHNIRKDDVKKPVKVDVPQYTPDGHEDIFDVDGYFPQEVHKDWFDIAPEHVSVRNRHLINIPKPIGINTIGTSLRNASYDLSGSILISNGDSMGFWPDSANISMNCGSATICDVSMSGWDTDPFMRDFEKMNGNKTEMSMPYISPKSKDPLEDKMRNNKDPYEQIFCRLFKDDKIKNFLLSDIEGYPTFYQILSSLAKQWYNTMDHLDFSPLKVEFEREAISLDPFQGAKKIKEYIEPFLS